MEEVTPDTEANSQAVHYPPVQEAQEALNVIMKLKKWANITKHISRFLKKCENHFNDSPVDKQYLSNDIIQKMIKIFKNCLIIVS